jgi:hypothetical protein
MLSETAGTVDSCCRGSWVEPLEGNGWENAVGTTRDAKTARKTPNSEDRRVEFKASAPAPTTLRQRLNAEAVSIVSYAMVHTRIGFNSEVIAAAPMTLRTRTRCSAS